MPTTSLAHLLRSHQPEHHVFRAVILSIVLTMAAGQNAAVLCRALCEPIGSATGCHHEVASTTPIVTGNGDCSVTLNDVAAVRTDDRRSLTDTVLRAAVVVSSDEVPPPAAPSDRASVRWSGSPLAIHPLVIAFRALRI